MTALILPFRLGRHSATARAEADARLSAGHPANGRSPRTSCD